MDRAESRHRPPFLLPVIGVLALAAAGFAGYQLAVLGRAVEKLTTQLAAHDPKIEGIYAEVTRLRLEQSTGTQGPAGLLQRLQTYAPLIADSRTTEPDVQNAKKEMAAVMRALESIGEKAWSPIVDRMNTLSGDKNFDELKWLLEAAVRVDRAAGKEIVKAVLQGTKFPAPRLRWYAADVLTDIDKPLAQMVLRQILSTESSRGPNLERATAYGASIPDKAAYATTGFDNFVRKYERTNDPQLESTLLMVMGRSEHDVITVQECMAVLGTRRSTAAVAPIQKLFEHPPGGVENPYFQNKCLDALLAIQGDGAREFFEAMLAKTTATTVANHLQQLLKKL